MIKKGLYTLFAISLIILLIGLYFYIVYTQYANRAEITNLSKSNVEDIVVSAGESSKKIKRINPGDTIVVYVDSQGGDGSLKILGKANGKFFECSGGYTTQHMRTTHLLAIKGGEIFIFQDV